MAKQLTTKPEIVLADRFLSGRTPPTGIQLEYVSNNPIEAGRLASDLAYVNGKWLDLEASRYWRFGKRPRDRRDLMAPEAVISVKEALVSPDNQIVTLAGKSILSPFFGSRTFSEPIPSTSVIAEYSGTYGTTLTRARAYGHWLLHRLPRLTTIHEQFPDATILNTPWGDSSLLARLGIREENVQRYPTSERDHFVYVENLLVPTHLSRPGLVRVQDKHRMERMVSSFTAGIPDDPTLPELLYVARRPDEKRSGASNKEELEEFLNSIGFTTWHPTDHPIERQIQHFQAARVVVSEIGSQALTSMFVGPDTTVIILTPEKSKGWGSQRQFQPKWRQWQRVVCEARGQHYAQIVAATDTAYRSFDLDMPAVRQALETYPLRTW
jgi:hypothetical protein